MNLRTKMPWLCLLALTAAMAFIYNAGANPRIWDWWNEKPENEAYNRLVQGFSAGHLYMRQDAPAGFAALKNPYDPKLNAPFLLADKGSLWDFSYYGGRFYLYYGPVPALLVMWPYKMITGEWLSQRAAAVFLFSVMFFLAGILLISIASKYFPGAGLGLALTLLAGVGLCGGIPIVLSAAGFYEVASASAAAFFMACLLALWMHLQSRSASWLVVASLAFGLAVGCRAEMAVAGVVLLMPFAADRRWRTALAAFLPCGAMLGWLAWYNFARFGSVTETGHLFLVSGAAQFHDSGFGFGYLKHNLWHYFISLPRVTGSFPFLKDAADADHENAFGLMTCAPLALLCGLAFLDMRRLLRRFVVGIGASMMALILVISGYQGSSARYQAEFTPFIFLLAAIGVLVMEPLGLKWFRRLWVSLLVVSAIFNLLITYRLQGEAAKTEAYVAVNLHHDAVRAEECYRRCLAIDDSHHEAHNQYGFLLLQLGRPVDAIPHFQRALELTPDWPEPRLHLAQAFLQTGQRGSACAQLDTLVTFDTNFTSQVAVWKAQILKGTEP